MNEAMAQAAAALSSILARLTDAGVAVASAAINGYTGVWRMQPSDPSSWLTAVREFRLSISDDASRRPDIVYAAGFIAGHQVEMFISADGVAELIPAAAAPSLVELIRAAVAAPVPA